MKCKQLPICLFGKFIYIHVYICVYIYICIKDYTKE